MLNLLFNLLPKNSFPLHTYHRRRRRRAFRAKTFLCLWVFHSVSERGVQARGGLENQPIEM